MASILLQFLRNTCAVPIEKGFQRLDRIGNVDLHCEVHLHAMASFERKTSHLTSPSLAVDWRHSESASILITVTVGKHVLLARFVSG